MTTAPPWASNTPAQASPHENQAAHTVAMPLLLAERVRLLSMHSFPHLHSALFTHLCERADELAGTPDASPQPFEPQLFSRWEQLLRASERITSGVVLLDLDEAEHSTTLRALGISAHRLCDLLARELREKPVALVLLTRMDYVEIEDLLRAGVAALLHPCHDVAVLAERVRIALQRRQRPLAAARPTAPEHGIDVVTRAECTAPLCTAPLCTAPLLQIAAPELPRRVPAPQSLPAEPQEQIVPAAP